MELYKEALCAEILCKELARRLLEVFEELQIDYKEMVNLKSIEALQAIKHILEDEQLDDKDCFKRIEEVVRVFEELGSNGGNRHDFG